MKRSSSLALIVFAVVSASGLARAESDKSAAPKAAEMQMEKSAAKPHSHVEEKTGVPQKAPAAKTDRKNAANDNTKHYHPRDGK